MTEQPSIFADLAAGLVERARAIAEQIASLPLDQQVAVLNAVRSELHAVSPFRDEPVDCVLWLPADQVQANDYNPNRVAPPEMRLLEISVASDGYTQPVVAYQDGSEAVEVVDGFHRARIGKESPKVRRRIHGYLPCSLIKPSRAGRNDRIAATIRHNRARGVHGVLPMTDIVAEVLRNGWTDDEVARELGMDADEVLRFKQNTGLPELFANSEYSRAWE